MSRISNYINAINGNATVAATTADEELKEQFSKVTMTLHQRARRFLFLLAVRFAVRHVSTYLSCRLIAVCSDNNTASVQIERFCVLLGTRLSLQNDIL
jgi:hypothetical protein